MFTDMVGYTALGQRNESLSLVMVEEQRKMLRPIFKRHNGREVKTMGDAFLVEFANALDAVRCAYDIQRASREFNISQPNDMRIRLRVGLHLGDVEESNADIFGDVVNVASRIEPLAEEGGVCVTRQVYDQVQNKFELPLTSLGTRALKNVSIPTEVYKMVMPWEEEKSVSSPQLDRKRIAVLPFQNISPDESDEYFADGVTEELISTMSRISGLRVIARTSVMGYKGGQKKISEVAKELEVGTVLEGSVRKAGERVRITVQLIDSHTSEHLWAESYDRELRDVFAIQSDISKTVAEALEVRLLSKEREIMEKTRTVNPEAYTLYLKGRFYWDERTKESVNKALKYFEQALKIDAKFALAYSGLADCYNIYGNYTWMAPGRAGPLARGFSLKALEIDENLAEAHASLALVLMNHSWDFVSAERELKRAIEIRPNFAMAYHWYADLLIYLRRFEEALLQEKLAVDIDPYSRVINMGIANLLAFHGKTDEAIARYRELIELNPDFGAVRIWKSHVHAWRSEHDDAIEEAKKAWELERNALAELNLAEIYALTGRTDEARKMLSGIMGRANDEYTSPAWIGLIELGLGRQDEGFKWLEKGVAERDSMLLYIACLPWCKDYRSNPRWKQIGATLGLP